MSKKRENKKKGKLSLEQIIYKCFPKMKSFYVNYFIRVIIFGILFFGLMASSLILFSKYFTINDEKIINYRETGNLDYRVNLKPNDFYETSYLGKNMNYVASLIKNIDIDFNYQFDLSDEADMNFDYSIVADLKITDSSESSVFYEKEYVLKPNRVGKVTKTNQYNLSDNVTIDYDYYNQIANSFKSLYGVDGVSSLTVYLKLNKNIMQGENSILSNGSSMSVRIPLTQRALNININDDGINNSNSIIKRGSVTYNSTLFVVFAIIVFIGAVAALLRFLELLSMMFTKKSKYDKQLSKILKEYDRLIVETPTCPELSDKSIIKITKFEELLDARDNLKLPIMYHNLINHHKCYFYIAQGETLYLYVMKEADFVEKDKKKKLK